MNTIFTQLNQQIPGSNHNVLQENMIKHLLVDKFTTKNKPNNRNQSKMNKIPFLAQNANLQTTRNRTGREGPPSPHILCLVFMLLTRHSQRQDVWLMNFLSDLPTSFLKLLLATNAAWNVTRVSKGTSRARLPNSKRIFH